MSYRDEPEDDPRGRPRKPAVDDAYDNDADFAPGDDTARDARIQTGSRSAMRPIIVVLAVLVVLAAGAFAAIHFRLIDPAQFGMGGSPGGATGGGGSAGPVAEAEIIFSGDSALLAAAPGNTVQADQAAEIAWLRSTVKSASAAGTSDGVSLLIPKALLPRFEGRRVRVTISARSGADGAPIPFAAAYSAGPKGNSNWVVFVPEKQFSDHSFSFVVPIGDLEGSDDHRIAIWSDIEGRGAPLGVRSITIRPD